VPDGFLLAICSTSLRQVFLNPLPALPILPSRSISIAPIPIQGDQAEACAFWRGEAGAHPELLGVHGERRNTASCRSCSNHFWHDRIEHGVRRGLHWMPCLAPRAWAAASTTISDRRLYRQNADKRSRPTSRATPLIGLRLLQTVSEMLLERPRSCPMWANLGPVLGGGLAPVSSRLSDIYDEGVFFGVFPRDGLPGERHPSGGLAGRSTTVFIRGECFEIISKSKASTGSYEAALPYVEGGVLPHAPFRGHPRATTPRLGQGALRAVRIFHYASSMPMCFPVGFQRGYRPTLLMQDMLHFSCRPTSPRLTTAQARRGRHPGASWVSPSSAHVTT